MLIKRINRSMLTDSLLCLLEPFSKPEKWRFLRNCASTYGLRMVMNIAIVKGKQNQFFIVVKFRYIFLKVDIMTWTTHGNIVWTQWTHFLPSLASSFRRALGTARPVEFPSLRTESISKLIE